MRQGDRLQAKSETAAWTASVVQVDTKFFFSRTLALYRRFITDMQLSASTPLPWPRLPPELQRDTFEIAARESTHTALVLVLVARHVQTW